jgi:hypothetical protein
MCWVLGAACSVRVLGAAVLVLGAAHDPHHWRRPLNQQLDRATHHSVAAPSRSDG